MRESVGYDVDDTNSTDSVERRQHSHCTALVSPFSSATRCLLSSVGCLHAFGPYTIVAAALI